MRQDVVVFKFDNPLTNEQESKLAGEFETLLEQIRIAMQNAEHKTTNTLQHSVFQNIRENLRMYFILERVSASEYRIRIATDVLKAFDVSLPINGVRTTGKQLADKIGSTLAGWAAHKASVKMVLSPKEKPEKEQAKPKKKRGKR